MAYQVRSLWRNRNFLLLWGGGLTSSIGTGVSQFAFLLLTLTLSRSPAQAGVVAALNLAPYFLLCLPAGVLVDRWDRKRVMVVCEVGRTLSLLSIPLLFALGRLSVLQLSIISLVNGIFFVFFDLAGASILPRLVEPAQLPTATSLSMITDGVPGLLGAPLGGLLYSIGRAFPFVADAFSYLVSACSLLAVTSSFQEEREKASRSLLREMLQGLRWLWHKPDVASLAVITGGLNLIFPTSALIVLVLAERQHVPPALIGVIFALGGGAYTLGTLLGGPLQHWHHPGYLNLGVCWVIMLLWPFFAVTSLPLMLGALLIGLSLLRPIHGVTQVSYRLAVVPDFLQGRVTSIYHLVALGSEPVGLALTGVLIQRFGVVPTILIQTGGLLILALAMTLNPHVRKMHLPSHSVD
jgi:MFS family permease